MAEYDLTARWLLRPQWFFRHQQSELNEYDYRRHTLLLSLEAYSSPAEVRPPRIDTRGGQWCLTTFS